MLVQSLKILLTAEDKTSKAFKSAEGNVKKLGETFNKVGGALTKVSAVLAGLGGVMVAQAAKYDSKVAGAVGRLSNAYNHLAVEIGRALLPVINALTSALTAVVRAFQSLSPETKQMVGTILGLTAAFTGLGAAGLKIVGVFMQLAPAILPLVVPLLAVAAVLGAIFVAAAFLREAWDTNFLGMRDTVKNVWTWVSDAGNKLWKSLSDGSHGFFKFFMDGANNLLRNWIETVKHIVNAGELIGFFKPDEAKMMTMALDILADKGVGGVLEAMKDLAKVGWDAFKNGADKNLKTLDQFIAKMKKAMGMTGGNLAHLNALGGKQGAEFDRSGYGPSESEYNGISGDMKWWDELILRTKKLSEYMKRTTDARDQRRAAGEGAAGMIQSKLPGPIQAGIQGAQAGGPLGALAGVILGALTESESFMKVMGALGDILGIAGEVLGMAFAPLVPILNVVANVFKKMAPALGVFATMIQMLAMPVVLLITIALPLLFEAFKWMGVVLIDIVGALVGLWNGLITAIQGVLNGFADLPVVGGLFKSLSLGLEGLKDKHDYAADSASLAAMQFDEATKSVAENAAANDKAAEAARDVSEALTNVAKGYKVSGAQFAAADPRGVGGGPMSVEYSSSAEGGGGGGTTIIVQGNLYGAEGVTKATEDAKKKARFRNTGKHGGL